MRLTTMDLLWAAALITSAVGFGISAYAILRSLPVRHIEGDIVQFCKGQGDHSNIGFPNVALCVQGKFVSVIVTRGKPTYVSFPEKKYGPETTGLTCTFEILKDCEISE